MPRALSETNWMGQQLQVRLKLYVSQTPRRQQEKNLGLVMPFQVQHQSHDPQKKSLIIWT